MKTYAGVELGGTKILCRVIDETDRVLTDGRFVTSTPARAVDDLCGCILDGLGSRRLDGLGVASFGPLVVDPRSPAYGRLLATPKAGWSGFDIRNALADRLPAPAAFDTDVNAAAVAEQLRGAGKGLHSMAYVTVGTGIGGGLSTDGSALKGALHPEVGHIRLRRSLGDTASSTCPFHDGCAEGLAAGPAIAQRLGAERSLTDAPEIFSLIAGYLGELAATLVLAWSPQRIVFGGGVMATAGLLPAVGEAMRVSLGDYVASALDAGFLTSAQLTHAGLEGALIMARAATVRW